MRDYFCRNPSQSQNHSSLDHTVRGHGNGKQDHLPEVSRAEGGSRAGTWEESGVEIAYLSHHVSCAISFFVPAIVKIYTLNKLMIIILLSTYTLLCIRALGLLQFVLYSLCTHPRVPTIYSLFCEFNFLDCTYVMSYNICVSLRD